MLYTFTTKKKTLNITWFWFWGTVLLTLKKMKGKIQNRGDKRMILRSTVRTSQVECSNFLHYVKYLMYMLKYICDTVSSSFTPQRKIMSTDHLINSLNKRKNTLQISHFLTFKASIYFYLSTDFLINWTRNQTSLH